MSFVPGHALASSLAARGRERSDAAKSALLICLAVEAWSELWWPSAFSVNPARRQEHQSVVTPELKFRGGL